MQSKLPKKITLLFILILISTINCQQETIQEERQPDDTDNMIQLSKLIVSTIDKYDYTQKGVIPFARYDQFLHQIFIEGNKFNKLSKDKEQVPQHISTLLRQATKQFKKFRYEQVAQTDKQNQKQKEQKQPSVKQFVELQQFYMDLIKHFSQFLELEQNKYKFFLVSDYFFMERQEKQQTSQESKQSQSTSEKNNEKLEL